jgi:hypothetical protein
LVAQPIAVSVRKPKTEARGRGLCRWRGLLRVVDTQAPQCRWQPSKKDGHPRVADGSEAGGAGPADHQVGIGGVGPEFAPVIEPGVQQVEGQVIRRLGVSGDRDPAVGPVDVRCKLRTRRRTESPMVFPRSARHHSVTISIRPMTAVTAWPQFSETRTPMSSMPEDRSRRSQMAGRPTWPPSCAPAGPAPRLSGRASRRAASDLGSGAGWQLPFHPVLWGSWR